MANTFSPINPPARLLMGPGPINADPRVLRAMSAQLLGQYDPAFRENMRETQELYRQIFVTKNKWTMLIDATSRGGIEALLVSIIEKGDVVLVASFGRFGDLLEEIASRCGADVRKITAPWGTVFDDATIEKAILEHRPKLLTLCQGDTSTTMCQPLAGIGALGRKHNLLVYVDATASIAGNPLPIDEWQIDAVSVGLQKCLGGPSGSAPITFNDRVAAVIQNRYHIEAGIQPKDFVPGKGSRIQTNYFDLAMIMAYWEKGLNHHTEATTMLYGARECARIILEEGLDATIERHRLGSRALVAGLTAMGLKLFGDLEHKMYNVTGVYIPKEVEGEVVRKTLLEDFGIEIGTSFGPLVGVIWRIGTMGYNCRKDCILQTLAALAATLRLHGMALPSDGIAEAHAIFKGK